MRRKPLRDKYNYSITLTLDQLQWLQRKENASELIRKAIDDLMLNESEEELQRLKREEELLMWKLRGLGEEKKNDTAQAYQATWLEIEKVRKKIQIIEKNIEKLGTAEKDNLY